MISPNPSFLTFKVIATAYPMDRKEQIAKQQALWASVSWEEVKTFIGPNAEGYKKVWEKNAVGIAKQGFPGFMFSWSWPALFPILGIPWAVSRKLWPFVGLMVGVIVIASVILAFFPNASFGYLMVLAPTMAKNFYIQTTVAKIAKIKETIPDPDAQMLAIREAGGLKMIWGLIAAAICVAWLVVSVSAMVAGIE
jgi:hypothetical protein